MKLYVKFSDKEGGIMNRAERRRLQKKGVAVKKEPTINIKYSDIQKMKEEAMNKAVDTAFILMLGLPVLVLRDNWGFGKVRLERFIDQVIDMYEAFNEGYLTLDDIQKVIEEETGIEIITK